MIGEQLMSARNAIVAQHGPWTAHRIDLGHGISTLDTGDWQKWRVDFFANLISVHSRSAGPLRLLDLACLEGLFAIEFARMGHETVGLEIRDAHLAKAEFARRALGLENCRFVRGDVRDIPLSLQTFDTILCAGIFYHLDFPDCVLFLRDIAERSSDLIVIDSHFAYNDIHTSVLPLSEMRRYELNGVEYWGREIIEHADHISDEEKASVHVWSSINNPRSVWLAEEDVAGILDSSGFRLVEKCYPDEDYRQRHPDRPTLVFERRGARA